MSSTTISKEAVDSVRLQAAATTWQEDLARDGFAVVKGAVPRDRADRYAERLHEWLEGL